MQKLMAFLKTTLVGGVLVVLPAWLTVLLLLKALMHLQIFVKPVSTHLPEGVRHPLIMASLLLITVCFVIGALIRTAVGRQVKQAIEHKVLERLPGYTTLRNVAEQIGELESRHGFRPALVEIEDALAIGFIVEEHADGRCTVFLPSSPTPAAGTIFIIDGARVHPVDVPVIKALTCVTKWGTGSGELLAAMRSP
jgi:uncharacterized membrane protein